ncbi:heat shock transcription factor, X-linked member 4-like [Dipodomys merriami]|uniref:heat shock transcription factor, X-linked member 4-like n=1 Tax=Dipodomys merriami TaxID=94247 RepID=UPI003855EE7C
MKIKNEENLQAIEEDQAAENSEGNIDFNGLSFPRKLWNVVECRSFNSVYWNDEGDKVVIEADYFQREILHRIGAEKIFNEDNLSSFFQQLNRHGFRKIHPYEPVAQSHVSQRIMTYRNSNFQRDKPELLDNIQKDLRNSSLRGTCIPIPLKNPAGQVAYMPNPKRRKLLPTRSSPRFHHKANNKNKEAKREVASGTGSRDGQLLQICSVWAMRSFPRRFPRNQTAQEQEENEEVPSRDVAVSSQGTSEMEGAEFSSMDPGDPDGRFVMHMYNSYFDVLMSTLSKVSTTETAEDADQEGPADYKFVVCEQCHDNPPI